MIKAWALALFLAGLWMVLVAPGSCLGGLHAGVFSRHQAREVRDALGPQADPEVLGALESLEGRAASVFERGMWSGWHHLMAGVLLITAAITIERLGRRPKSVPPLHPGP